jgi:hypothetical protein
MLHCCRTKRNVEKYKPQTLKEKWSPNVCQRETREGRPLLTVETEVNRDSKSTNERGPSLAGFLGLSCQYRRFLFCLGCSSGPVQNIFFLTVHYLNSFVPIVQQAGQADVLGRLSLSMCLWSKPIICISRETYSRPWVNVGFHDLIVLQLYNTCVPPKR